jgi:phosphate acetyltransferase
VDHIVERARQARCRIAFPEPEDERIVAAAGRLAADGIVTPVLVGRLPARLPPGVEGVDPSTSPRLEEYAAVYHQLTAARGTGP